MSDAWEGPSSASSFGTASYGQGLFVNQAFSIDNIFRMGLAALQEQPLLVLLGGLNLLVVQIIPQFAGYPIQIGFGALGGAGALDPDLAQAIGTIGSSLVGLLFLPVQQVITAGVIVAAAGWIAKEEVSVAALYTSFAAGLRAFLVTLVVALVAGGLLMGLGAPIAAVFMAMAYVDQVLVGTAVTGFLFLGAMVVFIYVQLGLVLAVYAAVLDELGPIAAIQASWSAASGARLTLLVNMVVFALLGAVACCMFAVPYIVVMGIQVSGFTAAWLLYARPVEASRRWGFVERNLPVFHDGF